MRFGWGFAAVAAFGLAACASTTLRDSWAKIEAAQGS